MDTRQLRTLMAIVQHGSFGRAAEAVHVTPSAVSQQMRALEDELGTTLFQRSSRPPTLTAHGLQVLDMARDILHREEEARAAITGHRVAGTLMLGSVRTSALGLLPRTIKDMRVHYPQLKINLRISNSVGLIADVAAGRLDAAVVAENLALHQSVRWSPFLREPLWLIAPRDMATGRDPATLLATCPFVRFQSPVPLASLIDTELAQMGIVTQDVAEMDSVASIMSCVIEGMGISVVPDIALHRDEADNLVRLPFGNPQIHRQIGLIERSRSSARAGVITRFHDILATACGAYGVPRKGAPEGG